MSQIKFNVLWSSIDDITSYLKKNNLLSESNIKEIENVVFSQNTNGVNLIRIQYIFWMIYSSKKNMKIEDVIEVIPFTQQDKTKCETYIVYYLKNIFPNWKPIKHKIPGDDNDNYTINYPPEIIQYVYEAVIKWGDINHIW